MEKGKIVKVILICWVIEGIIHSTSFYKPTLFGVIQMLHFVGTLLVLIVCYALVYRQQRRSTIAVASFHASKSESSSSSTTQAPNSTTKQTKSRERRLIKNVLTLLLTHFIFIVLILIVIAGSIAASNDLGQRDFAFFLGILIASINPTRVNPTFYVFRTHKIRKRLLKLFCCRKKRVSSENH